MVTTLVSKEGMPVKTSGIRVIAEDNGVVTEYKSINKACEAYGIGHDRMIRLILVGEALEGVCFDWAHDADDITDQIELTYKSRVSHSAEDKRRRRRCSIG